MQSQFATTKRRTVPFVYTKQAVAMLSAILNIDSAINVSIRISVNEISPPLYAGLLNSKMNQALADPKMRLLITLQLMVNLKNESY